jgi:DNA-binding transcriptional LysR family regulator
VHLAQPSATKLIRDLERLFGFPLFERLPRGMEPTELGKEVVTLARRLLEELERFAHDVDTKRQGGCGQLIVGVIAGAGSDLVSRALSGLKRQHPLLSVKLVSGTSDETLEMLIDHKLDIAVGAPGNAKQRNLIHYENLGQDPLCIVARKDHPLQRSHGLDLAALRQSAWILPPQSDRIRQIIEREFERVGLMTPENVVECASSSSTLRFVLDSDAVALVPQSAAGDNLYAGVLVELPVALSTSSAAFGVVSRRAEPLTSLATEFIQLLRQHCRTLNGHRTSHEWEAHGVAAKARPISPSRRPDAAPLTSSSAVGT